ncbi:ribose 5-phosphate isomerase A [Bacillus sp. FJAT-27225]|uniref:ribose-5-phosphate isomerase RpiA n=1 Tax=Bacillus sp. FJAT-27225 TaxID=1743144 RepID=UPI00080C2B88|nr:ribose-5-phosphate isomerase RpiA [Bacillus sp. FJAT-27225]OCA85762.1 ribose 5-phosphate isomerase A [Bacillus sp. FJAT-27225]
MNQKQLVGERAAQFVKDGMVVGLGSGSTVFYTIQKLGQLVHEGLSIQGIPTSVKTEQLARQVGIPLADFKSINGIDVAIDGADEVDSNMDLIKGGGGSLLREKIIDNAANEFIVVADAGKLVKKLGAFRLPVEVVPFGMELTVRQITELGGVPRLRETGGRPFITDNGNLIVDCDFGPIGNSNELEASLNKIPGVVENGLFVGIADKVVTLDSEGKALVLNRNSI